MRTELVTTLKRHATELLAELEAAREPILITQHGVPSAYLVDIETFQQLHKRIEVLEGIARGERAVTRGRVLSHAREETHGQMVEVVWTRPALSDLDTIADYIALDNDDAARRLVRRVFAHVEQLAAYPESGSHPPELSGRRYRQIVEPPCRVFYRIEGRRVYILLVMRSEQRLRPTRLRSPRRARVSIRRGSS